MKVAEKRTEIHTSERESGKKRRRVEKREWKATSSMSEISSKG